METVGEHLGVDGRFGCRRRIFPDRRGHPCCYFANVSSVFFLIVPLQSNRHLKHKTSTLMPAQCRPRCQNIGTFIGCVCRDSLLAPSPMWSSVTASVQRRARVFNREKTPDLISHHFSECLFPSSHSWPHSAAKWK